MERIIFVLSEPICVKWLHIRQRLESLDHTDDADDSKTPLGFGFSRRASFWVFQLNQFYHGFQLSSPAVIRISDNLQIYTFRVKNLTTVEYFIICGLVFGVGLPNNTQLVYWSCEPCSRMRMPAHRRLHQPHHFRW